MRRCAQCKERFEPVYNTLQKVCSPGCAVQFAKTETPKRFKREARAYRKANKPQKSYLTDAQKAVNGYIRTRDEGKPCISCEGFKSTEMLGGAYDAGHWHGVGPHPKMRFVLWNIHRQCKHCNDKLNGHPIGYEIGLMKRFSRKWVEKRKQQARDKQPNHYSKDQLARIARIFRKKERLYRRLFRQ